MPRSWTTIRTELLLQDRWLTVRRDACINGQGRQLDPYYVLQYPGWVNVFALTSDQSVLFVRQYRHGPGQLSLELPGGVIEPDDPSPEAAASRELLEETGYYARSLRLYLQCSPNAATHNNVQYSFLAQDLELRQSPTLDDNEDLEVVSVPLTEVSRMAASGQIIQGLHIAAILAACLQDDVKAALTPAGF